VSVGVSVGLSVTLVNPAKAAESIETPKKPCTRSGPDPMARDNFKGEGVPL